MNTVSKRFYAFAAFRVDLSERKLWRGEEIVPLRPKLFDLLVVLIENRGRTLQREELFKTVWGELSMGDAETHGGGNLSVNISALRRVLGDDLEQPAYIETSPRHGYRFIAEVREWEESAPAASALSEPPPAPPPRAGLVNWLRLPFTGRENTDWLRRYRPLPWLAPPLVLFSAFWFGARFWQRPGTDFARPLPLINSMTPPSPAALIGDQRVTVWGQGFQAGLTLTVVFANGQAATLSGVQILEVTPDSFSAWIDFNGNPEVYRLRVNNPDGQTSNLYAFTAQPFVQAPAIAGISPARPSAYAGAQPVSVVGQCFQIGVSATVTFPNGRQAVFADGQVANRSATAFTLLLDFGGLPGRYQMQLRNPNGRTSEPFAFEATPLEQVNRHH